MPHVDAVDAALCRQYVLQGNPHFHMPINVGGFEVPWIPRSETMWASKFTVQSV